MDEEVLKQLKRVLPLLGLHDFEYPGFRDAFIGRILEDTYLTLNFMKEVKYFA